jgi:hypothetical protein
MNQRGFSPWTPDVAGQPPRAPRAPRRRIRLRVNGSALAVIAGCTAFVAVVAVVVVVGLNHKIVEAGTPIAVSRPAATATAATTAPTTTTQQPTTSTVPAPSPTSLSQGVVPSGYLAESGPAGIQVNIPAGWTITSPFASEDEADDPTGSGSLIRYGGTPSPSMSLLDAVTSDETGNTSVKTGYQQLQLNQVSSPTGDDTVVWEFLFDKNNVQRHALGWFWRANGTDYVVYFSSTVANWPAMQSIAGAVEQTAGPV